MSLSIHIPQFEGPLGLLLYLIRKEEMDIFDIDVQLITSQYLEYIKKMKQFDLEVAGDFIAMAATLIQIKSKMLLPNYNEEGEEEEIDDPRKELVQRLIEYQKFQEISKSLYERPLLGRDVFRRGKSDSIHSDEDGEIILDDGGLFSLIAHYRNSVRKMKRAIHKVARKTRSIAGRIMEMKNHFVVGQRVLLRELITSVEDVKQELLITFLSCLEMGKMGLVSVYQAEVYGDIYLTAKKEITLDSISRVEEYDSQGAEDLADSLMQTAEQDAVLFQEEIEVANNDDSEDSDNEGSEFQMASDNDIDEAEKEMDLGLSLDEPSLPEEPVMQSSWSGEAVVATADAIKEFEHRVIESDEITESQTELAIEPEDQALEFEKLGGSHETDPNGEQQV